MLSFDEIMNLSPEEFSAKWKTGEVQDASLKLIGAQEMTEEERKDLEEK